MLRSPRGERLSGQLQLTPLLVIHTRTHSTAIVPQTRENAYRQRQVFALLNECGGDLNEGKYGRTDLIDLNAFYGGSIVPRCQNLLRILGNCRAFVRCDRVLT